MAPRLYASAANAAKPTEAEQALLLTAPALLSQCHTAVQRPLSQTPSSLSHRFPDCALVPGLQGKKLPVVGGRPLAGHLTRAASCHLGYDPAGTRQ